MSTNKPNTGFWIVAVIATIWNLIGVMMYLGTVYMTEDARAMLTAEQLEVLDTTPAWVTGLFALAVFSGALASLLLLLRKKLAVMLFALSLLCILINNGYSFLATDAPEAYGLVQGYIMPLIVILIGIFLYVFSKQSAKKGWLS